MKLWVLTGKLLLAVGTLAVGLTIYQLWPEAQMVMYGYWAAIFTSIIALETAWFLYDRQKSLRPRLLAHAGLQLLQDKHYRNSSTTAPTPAAVSRNPATEVGRDRDIERDLEPPLLNILTRAGSDNRFELIIAPSGAGKSTLLHRVGLELLKRSYLVCSASGRIPPQGVDGKALRYVARQTRRLFVLIDDMELAPIAGSLLETVLGHDDGITVLGSCSQHGYDAMLQGGSGGVNTRDLMSVANLHQLRMTPRESQMFSDRAVREQVSTPERAMMARQLELGGESDLLTLAISLEQGCSPSAMAVAAMDELDEQQQTVLYGLAVAAVTDGGVSQTLLQTLFGRNALEAIDAIAARGLAVRREGYVWGPHQAMALHVLRAHGMLDSRQQVDLAERILRTLHATDPVRANAVTRVLLHADTELGPPLWSRCADLWVTAAEQSEPAELVELIAPTLRLAGDHGTAAGFLQRHLNHATLGRRASFELARCLHRLSSYNAAADIFESFLEDKSYSVVARLNLALSAIGQGRYEDAELLLRVLEKNELGIPGLHHLLGYVAELRGDLPVAMERYQQARGQYWFDNLALRRLGSLKIATGANREAIRLFEAGLQQEPDRVEYYGALAAAHYLDDNAARAAAQSVRAIQAGVEPALARKAVAHGYFQYGLYEPALTELRNCLIYRPDDLEAHVMIAECLHNQNNLREATEALYDALEIDADFVTAKQHLASYLCDLKQYEQATRLIDEILGSQSPTAELSLLAARVAANAGDMQTSARHAAIALDAGDESGWGWFISAHATTDAQAQYNYEKAIPLLSQTTVTAPRLASASACQALAIARCALGDHPGAFRAARQGTNRLIHELYGGEPVLSAVALRHIAGKEFLQEIAQLTDEMRQTDRVTE